MLPRFIWAATAWLQCLNSRVVSSRNKMSPHSVHVEYGYWICGLLRIGNWQITSYVYSWCQFLLLSFVTVSRKILMLSQMSLDKFVTQCHRFIVTRHWRAGLWKRLEECKICSHRWGKENRNCLWITGDGEGSIFMSKMFMPQNLIYHSLVSERSMSQTKSGDTTET